MSYVFKLTDAPGYLAHFPVLKSRNKVGRGQFSVVFEGSSAETVLKLTCDEVYVDFLRRKAGTPGLPRLIHDYGSMPSPEHSAVFLVELSKLYPLHKWDHTELILERNALANAVDYKLALNELYCPMAPCQQMHALALLEVQSTGLFSPAASAALEAIADYLEQTSHDVLLDLANLANYMTDGSRLIITDPVVMVQ